MRDISRWRTERRKLQLLSPTKDMVHEPTTRWLAVCRSSVCPSRAWPRRGTPGPRLLQCHGVTIGLLRASSRALQAEREELPDDILRRLRRNSHNSAPFVSVSARTRRCRGQPMSLWLSKEELIELTGYKRAGRQKLALGQMGLKFRSRPLDGFPLVDRWQFEGEIVRQRGQMWRQELNWDAINQSPSATTRMLGRK